MAKAPSKRGGEELQEMHLNITSLIDVLTILLVFLLKSYSAEPQGQITLSDEIKLPGTISQLKITEQKTSVTITKKAVLIDNKVKVADIGDGWQLQGIGEDNPFEIAELISGLQEIAEKKKYIADHNPAFEFDGEILIQGDQTMPSRVLAAILYSVGQAEFDKIKLMAISKLE